jgi:hypothetical protein
MFADDGKKRKAEKKPLSQRAMKSAVRKGKVDLEQMKMDAKKRRRDVKRKRSSS